MPHSEENNESTQLILRQNNINDRVDELQREYISLLHASVEGIDVLCEEIFSFSGHMHVMSFWKGMGAHFGLFEFMIDEPEKLVNIQRFEREYRHRTGDSKYTIPGMLRVSLLTCEGVQLPQVFDHSPLRMGVNSNNVPDCISIFQSFVSTVDQWKFISDRTFRFPHNDIDDIEEYLCDEEKESMYILQSSGWFDPESDLYSTTIYIGGFGDEPYARHHVFMNGDHMMHYRYDQWEDEYELQVVKWSITDFFMDKPVKQRGTFQTGNLKVWVEHNSYFFDEAVVNDDDRFQLVLFNCFQHTTLKPWARRKEHGKDIWKYSWELSAKAFHFARIVRPMFKELSATGHKHAHNKVVSNDARCRCWGECRCMLCELSIALCVVLISIYAMYL